mmetsp:Transcript_45078/g.104258  ORF Transcript_45078/g.104258 Transcript_45078/m.104258 type:complete len:765 (-) Transcript_45078:83-2377(-)
MSLAATEPADDRQTDAAVAAPSEGLAVVASADPSEPVEPQLSVSTDADELLETRPVWSIGSDTEEQRLQPRSSVYCFMLFLPPLSVKRCGHYCTTDVVIIFLLFCLCTVLQVSLTVVGGREMLTQHEEDHLGLVQKMDPGRSYLSVLNKWPHFNSSDEPEDEVKLDLLLGRYLSAVQRLHYSQNEKHCCQGVECSGFGVQCCMPAASAATPSRPRQQLRRHPERHRLQLSQKHIGESLEPPHFSLVRWAFERKPGGTHAGESGGERGGSTAWTRDLHDNSETEAETQRDSHPLCIDTGGILSCTSHSVPVVPLWGELDVDGDGRWTYWEALADANNLGCRLASPLVEVFRRACAGITRDAADSTLMTNHSGRGSKVDLPPEVANQVAIPRAYFEWWHGLVAICHHGSEDLCEALLQRGTFSGTFARSRAFLRGGIVDLHTALSYCQRLLRPGGICDDALPALFPVYRARMQEKCGPAIYRNGPRVQNPYQEQDRMTVMSVSFTRLEEMQYVHSVPFALFLWLILILWYIGLINEAKELLQLYDFLNKVPVVDRWPFFTPEMWRHWRSWLIAKGLSPRLRPAACTKGLPKHEPEASVAGYDKIEIHEFSRPHFYTCIGIAVIRSLILLLLGYTGTYFLLSNHVVLDLILNALALAFIFDLDEFLFEYLLSDQSKELVDKLAPLRFKGVVKKELCTRIMSERFCWGSFFIPAFALCVVALHNKYSVAPYIEALECLCMQTGDRCLLNIMFYPMWWDEYWSKMAALR